MKILPPRWHAQFLGEYRTALDAAVDVRHWPELREPLHRWQLRAAAYADPDFEPEAWTARHARTADLEAVPGWDDPDAARLRAPRH
jgi:hypothetical protein